MGHVVREIAWCTIDIDTRMGRVFLQERWQYIWKVQPRRPTAEPSLPNHLGRDEQDDPGYQVLGQEPMMHHLQFYRTLSLAFVLAIAYSHEASAEGSRESAVPVAVSTRTPQEQSKLTDRSSSVDAEEAARFDWSGDSCDTVSRLPKLLGLGVAELERRVGPPDHKESFRLGERQHEFHIALQNTYPLTIPENANLELQEWSWSGGDCRLTVWLHRVQGAWRSFDNVRWHWATEF